ncbi:MAG: hypothetical protein K6G81_00775 [Lachnospiraceae bacterium]|nr:hypothetical protein [Lachnospiraceae bacterium]
MNDDTLKMTCEKSALDAGGDAFKADHDPDVEQAVCMYAEQHGCSYDDAWTVAATGKRLENDKQKKQNESQGRYYSYTANKIEPTNEIVSQGTITAWLLGVILSLWLISVPIKAAFHWARYHGKHLLTNGQTFMVVAGGILFGVCFYYFIVHKLFKAVGGAGKAAAEDDLQSLRGNVKKRISWPKLIFNILGYGYIIVVFYLSASAYP